MYKIEENKSTQVKQQQQPNYTDVLKKEKKYSRH